MAETMLACPLRCRSNAVRQPIAGGESWRWDCEVCGRFTISQNTIAAMARPGDEELLPYLTCHTRQANERGQEFTVASHNWREFARSHKNTPFTRKVAMLLDIIAARSNFQPGGRISVDSNLDWPHLDTGSAVELDFLLTFLIDEGYANKKFDPAFQLTPKAWERFEKAGTGQGIPGKCFVAMSFDESLKKSVYEDGILPAIKLDCGMDPRRIDLVSHNDNIVERIIAEIRTCQFMVADFTGHKAGVYFEAGFAKGLGREVIWTCREDDFKNIHFDIAQFSHIVWKDSNDLRMRLAIKVKATIPGAV